MLPEIPVTEKIIRHDVVKYALKIYERGGKVLAVSAVVRAVAGKPRKLAFRGYRRCNVAICLTAEWAHVTVRPSFCSVFVSGSCAQPNQPSEYNTSVGTVDLSIAIEVNELKVFA